MQRPSPWPSYGGHYALDVQRIGQLLSVRKPWQLTPSVYQNKAAMNCVPVNFDRIGWCRDSICRYQLTNRFDGPSLRWLTRLGIVVESISIVLPVRLERHPGSARDFKELHPRVSIVEGNAAKTAPSVSKGASAAGQEPLELP